MTMAGVQGTEQKNLKRELRENGLIQARIPTEFGKSIERRRGNV